MTQNMSPAEFHKLIERLDLSVYAAARTLGVSISTAQRYANGNSSIPEPVARLLRMIVEREHAKPKGIKS